MYRIIIVIAAVIVGVASVFITKKDNNIVEEMAEEVIEQQLNLPKDSINLSPKDEV